ncbi:MAG: phosphate signaling complex protein PhoU [Pseudomonadota bacterium]
MPVKQDHIFKAYDSELKRLRSLVSQMGGMAEAQISSAIDCLMRRDSEAAHRIVAADRAIDRLEAEIEKLAIRTIALRAPMADDLREIIAALKISAILERIGDYAKNIAKRTTVLSRTAPNEPVAILPQMATMTTGMVKDVLDAYVRHDANMAAAVIERDRNVDDLYNSLFRELLTYMMENPRTITPATHLLFIAKNIERIGDHATNIAEIVYFVATGTLPETGRQKHDDTSFTFVSPPEDAEEDGADKIAILGTSSSPAHQVTETDNGIDPNDGNAPSDDTNQ